MAQTNRSFSDLDKIKHFSARVSDMSLSQGQRDYAAKRLAALTGNGNSKQSSGNRQGNGSARQSNNRQNNNNCVSGGKPNVLNVFVHTVK